MWGSSITVRGAVLLLVGSLFLNGCGGSTPPTPTPDVPVFSSGEAINIVEEYLAAAHPVQGTSCLTMISRLSQEPFEATYLPLVKELAEVFGQPGAGDVWVVTKSPFSWLVYESTLTVRPLGPMVSSAPEC